MTEAQQPLLRIWLTGRFRAESLSGQDVTPHGVKACGLLALLAAEPRMSRSRPWLQDRLWSDSPPEQGAASLRQALVRIRKSLGPLDHLLQADRILVRLDHTRVQTITDGPGEFLEGLDIRDPEFEAWLALQRSRQPAPAAASAVPPASAAVFRHDLPRPRRELVIETVSDAQSRLGVMETQFADAVSRSLSEMFAFATRRDRHSPPGPGALALTVHGFEAGPARLGLRVAVHDGTGLHPPWAETVAGAWPAGGTGFGLDHLNLCFRTTTALIALLSRPVINGGQSADANFLAGRALRLMFSMRHDALAQADTLFANAHALDPRGLFLAWRAQLAVIRFVESGGADRAALIEQADAFCAEAMAQEATNSNVLAAVANARLVLNGDGAAARELSRLSVRANPANPLAWFSWAFSLLYTGEAEKAHAAAKSAQLLANQGSFRFWTDFQVALTALATGRLEEAIANSEVSRALSPSFRPPLRYLIGLYSTTGQEQAARSTLERLTRVEPDFSLDRMIGDVAYPVSLMRKQGLVDAARLRDL